MSFLKFNLIWCRVALYGGLVMLVLIKIFYDNFNWVLLIITLLNLLCVIYLKWRLKEEVSQ